MRKAFRKTADRRRVDNESNLQKGNQKLSDFHDRLCVYRVYSGAAGNLFHGDQYSVGVSGDRLCAEQYFLCVSDCGAGADDAGAGGGAEK